MDRKEILETATTYITQDRAATHGNAEDNTRTIAEFWSTYLGCEVTPADVCAMMVLLKTARIKSNPAHADNWIDQAGYAALGGERATASQ